MSLLEGRLAARQYSDATERRAFRLGYKDGWKGSMFSRDNIVCMRWPNAYSAGYWEGRADHAAPKEIKE